MEKVVVGLVAIGYIFLMAFILILPVWWGWNTFFHDLLHLPAIDYWFQALALSFVLGAAGGYGSSKS